MRILVGGAGALGGYYGGRLAEAGKDVTGTVNLSPSGRARWQAEDDAGRDFRLPQQPC